MAVFGIGARWEGADDPDKTDLFLSEEVAALGYNPEEAPAVFQLLGDIQVGDIIFIKSHPPQKGLYIKAVGIVTEDESQSNRDIGGACLKVRWEWDGEEFIGKVDDKYNVRNITLYEETNPKIRRKVIDLLLS